jgi:ureidoacrylate peracid hydrolase
MQNGFCHPNGTFATCGLPIAAHRAIFPAIDCLRTIFRSQDRPIIYTRVCFAEDYSDGGLVAQDMIKNVKGFIRGSWDADIVDELKPDDGDAKEFVLDKTRNTAFWQTPFASQLANLGVDHLVVTGVGTNVCVESTVRDAITYGYPAVTVGDATATVSEEQHKASLLNLQWFGGTATVDDICRSLQAL